MNINPGHMNLLRKFYKSILTFLFIVFLSLYPFQKTETSLLFEFEHTDKIVHFAMYAFFAFVLFYDLKNKHLKNRTKIILLFSLIIFSGIIELLQEYAVSQREGDIVDLASNTIGIAFGFLIFKILKKKLNLQNFI